MLAFVGCCLLVFLWVRATGHCIWYGFSGLYTLLPPFPFCPLLPSLSGFSSCSLVLGLCPCWRFATSCFCFFFLLAVPCAYVVGGCSCGVVMLCLRCPCLLSLLNASSPKGASAHVMHAVLLRLVCPLASCPVMVFARMLARLCATRARACLCCGCGGWARS